MASNDASPEAMQARIQQARREAETLKDRIKRKKDELADTTRKKNPISCHPSPMTQCVAIGLRGPYLSLLT
jgi:guanine nucleotide-binding protein G(I)/G(S)/G(T) subunit beta-1